MGDHQCTVSGPVASKMSASKISAKSIIQMAKKILLLCSLNAVLSFVSKWTSSIVMPQNWLFLTSYKKFREMLLKNNTWHLIARLGPGAFETISGRGREGNIDKLESRKP